MTHRVLISLFGLFLSIQLFAQTTKVRGQVLDDESGNPLPFVSVFFKGTQVGTTTDNDGYFSLSTKDIALDELCAQLLGYKTETIKIRPGVFSNTMFFLKVEKNVLAEAIVKADNKRIKKLLADIDAHKDRNNPERRPGYECQVYSKMELDLTHPNEQLKGKALKKQWSFIFDYVDTSEISGIPYLPIMINETLSKRYHSLDPDIDREVITARRLSGAKPDETLLAQFTGSMVLKHNFYDSYMNAFNVRIPSPVNANGTVFYNYYIIDTLEIDNRKTYMVRYHPKTSISTPAFDGEMFIDAEDFAIRKIKARLLKGQNINWVRDMVLESEYNRMEDSTWFYDRDRFYADFSITMSDSSKLMSFIGNRTLRYFSPKFEKPDINAQKTPVSVTEDAGMQNEEFWSAVRPEQLTDKEKKVYSMVDRIQGTKLYNTLYDIISIIINGYYDIGPIGIGPYHKIISFNPLEGVRLRMGVRTSNDWSKTDRIGGYLAYGFEDKQFKGGVTWEHLFSKTPTSKLTLDVHYDVLQLGSGNSPFNTDGNILSSIMGAGFTQKLLPVTEASALYEHEFTANFNTSWRAMFRDYHANSFVPMVTPAGEQIRSIYAPTADMAFRFSKDETVIRGAFIKTYAYSKYPIVTISLNGGLAMFNPMDKASATAQGVHPYFRPEISLDWRASIPPVGRSKLHINMGAVLGQVPYPMLKLHEGNGTILYDKTAFSCMDFFEFASDYWITLMWDYNFYGFFLGKIPLLKKLQWREAVILRTTWGYLSKKNDGTLGLENSQALLTFPKGTRSMGSIPYVEAGFAITNILRLFRVDFIWRCTHRNDEGTTPRNFMVNLGLELKF